MEQKKLDSFCGGVRFFRELNDEYKEKGWGDNIEGMILFEPVICLLIGVVEKSDEVEGIKHSITERLCSFQKEAGKVKRLIWEFDMINFDDLDADTLIKGVEKPVICIVDKIIFENWLKATDHRVRSDREFMLLHSYITYLYNRSQETE